MRLDEDKLETLRSWGQRLGEASGAEYAAAGRALMLIEEIDQLQVDLRHLRRQLSRVPAVSSDDAVDALAESFAPTLHERLQRVLERDGEAPPGTEPDPVHEAGSAEESKRTTTSPQSWIDALRRQR